MDWIWYVGSFAIAWVALVRLLRLPTDGQQSLYRQPGLATTILAGAIYAAVLVAVIGLIISMTD